MLETNLQQVFQQLRQEGKQEGRQESVLQILNMRFSDIPKDIANKIAMVEELEELDLLLQKAMTASSIAEFKKYLVAKK